MFPVFVALFLAGVIAVVGAVNTSIAPENYLPRTAPEAAVSAPALLAVREAAFAYVRANGLTTGSSVISYSSFASGVRAPLSNTAGYSAMVSGGYLLVWAGTVSVGPDQGFAQLGGALIARQMVEASGGSRLVGYNNNGTFTHPLYGATSLTLPAEIPNGAAVALRPLI